MIGAPPLFSWDWMQQTETPASIRDSLPIGWEIVTDTGYCGSSICRRIEAHRVHSAGEHRACTVTVYGPYEGLVEELLRKIAAS